MLSKRCCRLVACLVPAAVWLSQIVVKLLTASTPADPAQEVSLSFQLLACCCHTLFKHSPHKVVLTSEDCREVYLLNTRISWTDLLSGRPYSRDGLALATAGRDPRGERCCPEGQVGLAAGPVPSLHKVS